MGEDDTTAILRALADPRRYDIVRELAAADAPMPCHVLSQAGQVTASTMTHHLQMLEQAGLIEIRREGRFCVLHLVRPRMEAFLRRLSEDARPAGRSGPAAP